MREFRQFLLFPVTFATIALIFFLLIIWQQFLLPLVIAIVIWYLIVTLATAVTRLPVVGSYLPTFFSYLLAFGLCIGTGWFVLALITTNITSLVQQLPIYEVRLLGLLQSWLSFLGISSTPNMSQMLGRFDLVSIVTAIASLTRDIARNAGIITIYVIFLLWEHHSFDKKLAALLPDKKRLAATRTLIVEISSQIQSYIRIKVFTSFITASASYLIIRGVGIDFAGFWGLLIFVLNFIPFIGSIVAITFPCLLALVQFASITPCLITTACLTVIQFLVGNIVEPKLMGSAFNLSGLAIILSLAIWGQIWGIVGMFLCVPLMVMLSITLASFSSTRPIAILLSLDGTLKRVKPPLRPDHNRQHL